MKWLFRIFLLWRGCRHKWETIKATDVYETAESKWPHSSKYHLRCSKCGDMIVRKL